ncbi:MAG: hypothetical protein J6I61_07860 [Prevotella sp.]|nr:hypothetical protein [Prevotella sp.]
MEILKEITKDVFEANVPAAKMPERNTSVFERMKLMLQTAYTMMIKTLVSPECEAQLDSDEQLKQLAIRAVCLDAFVRTCRSLDLVLTATGFGIVSTESTAPASRVRVEALIEEMAVEELHTIDLMLQLLVKVNGWGLTEQARQRIPTLFYRPMFLKMWATMPLTSQNWQLAQGRAASADAFLRAEISEEYMDELLQKVRTATLENADIIVVDKCNRFTGDYLSNYELSKGMPNKQMLRAIMEQLESYPDSYPIYVQSRLYAKRHAERYQNKKQDPTFFFM